MLFCGVAEAAQPVTITDVVGNKATIRNLSSNDSINVAIVDGSGDQITSFGGGTQYSDETTQADPTGTAIMGRDDLNIIRVVSIDNAGRVRTIVSQEAGAVMRVINTGSAGLTTITQDTGSVANVSASQFGTWTVTANAGTNLNTSSLATESTLSALNGKITSVDTGKVTISTFDVPVRVTQDSGAVMRVINVGSSGSGFSDVDNSAFTFGAGEFVPVGGVYNPSNGAVTSGNAASARLTENRAIHFSPRAESGRELVSVSQDAIRTEVVRTRMSVDTYSAATFGYGITLAAAPTDFFELRATNANKLIRVKRITIGGFETTARQEHFFLIKRMSANSGGTAIVADIMSFDTSNASPTGVVRSYTANPTLGTPSVTADVVKLMIPNATTALQNSQFIWTFDGNNYNSPVLRNGQQLSLNYGGRTKSAKLSIDASIIWTEESIP